MRDAPPPSERPQPDATALAPGVVRRYAFVTVVLVLAVVLVGFLRGVREPPPISRSTGPTVAAPSEVPTAVRYAEMPEAPLWPSRQPSTLSSLRYETPDPFAKVIRTEEMKLQALADRLRNRAYDGAPPAIPHGVDQTSAANCLACHEKGAMVGDRLAARVSHPHYPNCLQCHVETARPELGGDPAVSVASLFEGAGRSGPGLRAGPGAPPAIPHTTWFRQDCQSCHGLLARAGLRTTHPWLTNCTQCHAPSAELDQVAFPEVRP